VALYSRDGGFVVAGLEAGTYDLRVQPGAQYAERWVRDVDAGRQGLEIRLESLLPVHVTIDVRVRDGEAERIILLNARPRSWSGATDDVPALQRVAEYSKPGGWPTGIFGRGYGGGGFLDQRTVGSYCLVPTTENSTELSLDEGLCWLGAQGTDRQGVPYFPIGTGLVRVESGEYHVTFELAAAVPVEGRLVGPDVLGLAVGIAHRGGKLIELDVGTEELRPDREVGADGSFSFPAVPVGDHELWVGTPTELAAGSPSHRQALTVDRKGVPFLEVAVAR
jgi:hypothetical protein